MATRWIRRGSKILNTRRASVFARPPSARAPALAPSIPERATLLRRNSSNSIVLIFSQLGVCRAWNRRHLSSQALVDYPAGGLVDVPLAQTGEGIAECELLKWFVVEGDYVEEFQPLCEVQSDKATIEITSRFKGKISQVLYVPGDIVKVGETMLKILVNEIGGTSTSDEDCSKASSDLHLNVSGPETSLNNQQILGGVLATPSVRHLAKQYDIDINDISGSGPFQERETKFMAPVQQGIHDDKILPLRGFQRSMVKSMTMAAKVPHFYYLEEINCNALLELKAAFQKENAEPDVKHTFLPFLIKSLSMALSKFPLMNSSFHEESHEIILKGCHNIGVAMATPNGLVVPNIKKVQSQSIMEITKELARLQQLAVGNKLSSEDITGGTITLSNIGSIGGKFGSPILNLPEVAIIAIGKIQKLPRFSDEEKVYPACVTNVTIGADHRIVDGATVARFCNEWKLLIEKPELLLLHMR